MRYLIFTICLLICSCEKEVDDFGKTINYLLLNDHGSEIKIVSYKMDSVNDTIVLADGQNTEFASRLMSERAKGKLMESDSVMIETNNAGKYVFVNKMDQFQSDTTNSIYNFSNYSYTTSAGNVYEKVLPISKILK